MQDAIKKKFIELYEAEADAIFRFAYIRISDREGALELMQETFLKFWLVLQSGEAVLNSRALLFTIVRNLIIDHYRKKKHGSLDEMQEQRQGSGEAEFELPDETTLGNMEIDADGRFALTKIKELSAPYREVIYLNFVEGMRPKEIGEILGESANSISVRLHRAIGELSKIMGYEIDNNKDEK